MFTRTPFILTVLAVNPLLDLIDPANPTKDPFGTLSKLTVLLFAWNTVLPTLSASRVTPAALGKVPL